MNIFLILYVGINLVGGERGLFSYFEKKNVHQESKLLIKVVDLEEKLRKVETKKQT